MSIDCQLRSDDPVRILTVGHSNIGLTNLLDLLKAHHVQRIVDVRSAPYSRFASQFNRETLAAELERAAIDYGWAGDYLGGRPSDPTCYFAGEVPDGKANYLELVNYAEVARRDWFLRGIARLLQRAEHSLTVVLCSEEDPFRCHRHRLITRTLMQRGVDVQHIRGNGHLEPARVTEDRIAREESAEQLGLFDRWEAS